MALILVEILTIKDCKKELLKGICERGSLESKCRLEDQQKGFIEEDH